MRLTHTIAAALIALSLPLAAVAQDTAADTETVQVKKRDMVFSSDGKKIGRIYEIIEIEGGAAIARIIYQNKFVSIPVNTLSAGRKGFVSSLTRAEIKSGE